MVVAVGSNAWEMVVFLSCFAAVVLLTALVTPVKVVPVLPVYVKSSSPIWIAPAEANAEVSATVIVPEPDMVSPLPITKFTAALCAWSSAVLPSWALVTPVRLFPLTPVYVKYSEPILIVPPAVGKPVDLQGYLSNSAST